MLAPSLRVLVISDDAPPDFSRTPGGVLALCTTPDALSQAAGFAPDVVLYDDGATTPSELRQMCHPAPVLVTVVDHPAPARLRLLAYEDEVYLHLVRPVDPQRLACLLGRVVR